MRRLALLVVAGCYTGSPAGAPPPAPPGPPAVTGPAPTLVRYPIGVVAIEQHWTDGKRTGTWRYFYTSGVRSQEVDYTGDRETARRWFDERGNARAAPPAFVAGCTSDADCARGPGRLAADGCCSAPLDCGGAMSKSALAAYTERCTGFYCGEPQPSSSCMGVMGTHPACQQGACVLAH